MKFSFLIILALLPAFCFSQEDLPSRIDRFDAFFSKKPEGNTEERIRSLREEITKTVDVNDRAAEAQLRKDLGLIQLTRIPQYDSAFLNFMHALELEDSLGLKEEQIITFLAMARVFEELGDYPTSIEMLDYAMELSRPFGEINTLVYILNNQGRVNTLRGAWREAEENYQLVLSNRSELNSRRPEAEAHFNLGQLYTNQRDFDKALNSYKVALEITRKIQDKPGEAKTLNEIGEIYALMKNTEKSLANHSVALQIGTRLNDLALLAETYNNIGILYYNQGQIEKAAANLALGLDAAKAIQSAEQIGRSYEYLSLCFKDTGDFQRAFEYKYAHAEMIAMVRAEKIEHESSSRQHNFVIGKKETKIRELQLAQKEREMKIEAQRRTQTFLTVLIGLGVVIILLVFYLYLIKRRSNISLEAAHAKVNRQNSELQKLNATKDKFFSIISHDLKGPLNSFTSFSRMLINHTESLSKEEIQMLAREIDKNLKNVFTLLENLLEWSRSQTGNIEFIPEKFDLGELIIQNGDLLSAQAKNKGIELQYNAAGTCPVNVHRHSINTVIRNLISNAIKFTPEGGSVKVSVDYHDQSIKVKIADTGVGMTEDVIKKLFRIDTKYTTQGTSNEKGTGLGLILCKDFVEKNGGTIGVESVPGKGSTFYFTLPRPTGEPRVVTVEKVEL